MPSAEDILKSLQGHLSDVTTPSYERAPDYAKMIMGHIPTPGYPDTNVLDLEDLYNPVLEGSESKGRNSGVTRSYRRMSRKLASSTSLDKAGISQVRNAMSFISKDKLKEWGLGSLKELDKEIKTAFTQAEREAIGSVASTPQARKMIFRLMQQKKNKSILPFMFSQMIGTTSESMVDIAEGNPLRPFTDVKKTAEGETLMKQPSKDILIRDSLRPKDAERRFVDGTSMEAAPLDPASMTPGDLEKWAEDKLRIEKVAKKVGMTEGQVYDAIKQREYLPKPPEEDMPHSMEVKQKRLSRKADKLLPGGSSGVPKAKRLPQAKITQVMKAMRGTKVSASAIEKYILETGGPLFRASDKGNVLAAMGGTEAESELEKIFGKLMGKGVLNQRLKVGGGGVAKALGRMAQGAKKTLPMMLLMALLTAGMNYGED